MDCLQTPSRKNYEVETNFASEDESLKFKKIDGKLQKQSMERQGAHQPPSPAAQPVTVNMDLECSSNNNFSTGSLNIDKKKDAKKKLTKADIGIPSNFRHVGHVGWDPDNGFDMNNMDNDMQRLFKSVGINPDDDLDRDTVEFIFDFVEKHGGIEAVKEELELVESPPPPPTPTKISNAAMNVDLGHSSNRNFNTESLKEMKRKLTKRDIGLPSDFRHVSHVGWDPVNGFDMVNMDKDMQRLFLAVGIKPDDNLDKETVDFIYDFVENHGGIEAVRREFQVEKSPHPPTCTKISNVDFGHSNISNFSTESSKEAKNKLTEVDIETSLDVRRVSYVGSDPDKGFNMSSLDNDMQRRSQSVGLNPVYSLAAALPPTPAKRKSTAINSDLGCSRNSNFGTESLEDVKMKQTEADMETPSHVRRVGLDPDKILHMNSLDNDMQRLFQSAGVNPDDNMDKDTVVFLYDFAEKHGGIEAVKREFGPAKSAPLPPTPTKRKNITNNVNLASSGNSNLCSESLKDTKKKLSEMDIETSSDFRHVSHVGLDPDKGFDNLDNEMQKLSQSVGVNPDGSVDIDTIDFIYGFVKRHGGIEAVKKEFGPAKPVLPPPTPTKRKNATISVDLGCSRNSNFITESVEDVEEADIETPSDIRHASLVSLDPDKGRDMNNLDNNMQELFQPVDINPEDSVHTDTVDFINEFLEKHD